jgi:hypothetical protein
MAGTLNSFIFQGFQNKFNDLCLNLLIDAYHSSITDKSILLDFEENDITAILHHYIDENPKRKKWKIFTNREEYLFDKDSIQVKGFAAKFSRIDMRYSTFWEGEEYKYFVEAKNLKSKDSNLKRRYIKTGIDNFLNGGKYENCDGILLGYILEGSIENCKEGINQLLLNDKRINEIINYKELIINNHKIFESFHTQRNIKHLFFDYTI